ncbi:histidine kinase [Methanococcoides methylutens]|uniref:Histidine kinase n=1 Tax=Methanococcoides methylutens TaxID=2226 RepID=A0A099T0S1_METMT|nr:CBS domain-containing protein [Methanococcoides methylutens]KGK98519.1 histidine kinase [Methanococcoides methylutens]
MVIGTKLDVEADAPADQLLNDIVVREIMTQGVLVLDITSTALEAAQTMKEENIGSLIVSKDNNPVGIITERDIVHKVMAKDVKPSTMLAEEIMSSPIITIKSSTDVIKASEMMLKSRIRRLAVTDDEKIIGIITDRDILTVAPGLNTILENLIEMNREQDIPGTTEFGRGVCQRCESYVESLSPVNGLMLCEDCKEDEGYYD